MTNESLEGLEDPTSTAFKSDNKMEKYERMKQRTKQSENVTDMKTDEMEHEYNQ